MSKRCVICTQVRAVHPEVGGGYEPHPFADPEEIDVPGYSGPERRHGVRRMDDRVAVVEAALRRTSSDRRKAG
jgi:hypothetical protein